MKQKLSWLLRFSLAASSLLIFKSIVYAHGTAEETAQEVSSIVPLDEVIHSYSLKFVFISTAIIAVFVLLTFIFKNAGGNLKKLFFAGIVLPTILTSLFLAGSTIYLNVVSSSGGPVHWHADYQIWKCGEKLDLTNPKGISNRVGTSTFHEHGDNRIHVEGVINNPSEASLGNFLKVVGGSLSGDEMMLPTTMGMNSSQNGDLCSDGSAGTVQVFVYQTTGTVFTQKKLTNPDQYVPSPYETVPPGDCIIVEFGPEKDRTDKLCEQYKVKVEQGKLYGR